MGNKLLLYVLCPSILFMLVYVPHSEMKVGNALGEPFHKGVSVFSPTAESNNSDNNNNALTGAKLKLFASIYPIYDFVKKIGKDKIDISVVVPPGIEPHDFEPTAKQIIDMQKASAIFINGAGFESWINKVNSVPIIDLSKGLPLDKSGQNYNPHVWLDPIMVKTQAKGILESLIRLDPQNKVYYTNNFNQFIGDLDKLNSDISSNLTNCRFHDFISFHDAFTYFSKRYGLVQHAIQGISPQAEIPPQKIKESIDLARKLGINVIFAEDHSDPRLADLIAKEINGKVLTLSTIEIISEEEKQTNKDYFSKMHDNLNNLKAALMCPV